MTTQTLGEAEQVRLNMDNIKQEIIYLKLHREVIVQKILRLRQIFESKIVVPKITVNLTKIGEDDLSIDLLPVQNATKEQLDARYEWYHLSNELAEINVTIEVKINLLQEYREHLKQYFDKQAQKITDEMIYEKLRKAQKLKNDMSPQELATLDGIEKEFPKRINGTKDTRLELYEALQHLVLQHG